MRTLIVHPKDQTTTFLHKIYEPISNKTVIRGGIGKNELRKLIENHDRVIMLGHGSPWGLLAVGQFPPKVGSYIIDYSYCDLLLAKKENIFIWCYANQFVERNRLEGFYTGMFLSELSEAFSWGYYISDSKLIEESNGLFAEIVAKNINKPLNILYPNVIQDYSSVSKTNPIAQFNLERLYLNSINKNYGSNRFCKKLRELP
jgi:hypothetical protein